ncbi:MAG: methylated-DNA--[protein]-cysteine S-methyltransferase [Mesorhizobium sp.]
MGMSFYHLFDTSLGTIGIAWRGNSIVRLLLPQSDLGAMARKLEGFGAHRAAPTPAVEKVIDMIRHYTAGADIDFSQVDVDAGEVGAMRTAIYGELRKVRHGETLTYGDLARRAGYPGMAREIGEAMGKNPVPLIVPCHRVVAANGKLGGFSAPGGAMTKEKMLRLERALAEPAQAGFGF